VLLVFKLIYGWCFRKTVVAGEKGYGGGKVCSFR
jgi:hypothetical protein